jgi:hypothetical protein
MRERVEQQRQDLLEEQAREQAEEEARSQSVLFVSHCITLGYDTLTLSQPAGSLFHFTPYEHYIHHQKLGP